MEWNASEEAVEYLRSVCDEDTAYALAWTAIYLGVKLMLVYRYTGACWNTCSLLHNVNSVCIGAYFINKWDRPVANECSTFIDHYASVILIQVIHSITDFVIFWKEMRAKPVYIYHHGILIIVSLILPFCPGCYYTVFAFTIAELGSLAIAVDIEWRKIGGFSRGLKRVVVFGVSRVVNLALLYKIWQVTPVKEILRWSQDGDELLEVNVPVCMVTTVGGSLMMLCVNGVTWFRMFTAYRKFKWKRHVFESKSMARMVKQAQARLHHKRA